MSKENLLEQYKKCSGCGWAIRKDQSNCPNCRESHFTTLNNIDKERLSRKLGITMDKKDNNENIPKCEICGNKAVNKDIDGKFYCDDHTNKSKSKLFEKVSIKTFLNMPNFD